MKLYTIGLNSCLCFHSNLQNIRITKYFIIPSSPVSVIFFFWDTETQRLSPQFFYLLSSSPANLSEIEFTQCLSSAVYCQLNKNKTVFFVFTQLGVGNPSPWKTCPRWPPQAVHVISMRRIPKLLSSCLLTAPGIAITSLGGKFKKSPPH